MRIEIQRLKKAVEGRTVFILGGGHSVTPDIVDILNRDGVKVFCLNSGSKFIHSPLGILWYDDSWAGMNFDFLNKKMCPKFYVRSNAINNVKADIRSLCNSTVLNKTGDFGLDEIIYNVRGNNSGAHAINLLINC
jgi:hypothetical protein